MKMSEELKRLLDEAKKKRSTLVYKHSRDGGSANDYIAGWDAAFGAIVVCFSKPKKQAPPPKPKLKQPKPKLKKKK